MYDIFVKIWNFNFALAPILSSIFVFELSSFVRRYMRWAYMPIYFMFFPLGHADKLYAEYVDEDDYYFVGANMTSGQKELLRVKIISTAFWSMIFSVIFNPLAAGIYSATFLSDQQFSQFITTLILLKFILLSISIWKLRYVSFIIRTGSLGAVVILYIVYLLAIWRITVSSFEWAANRFAAGGFYQLAISSIDFLIFNIGIYGVITAALGAAISYWMTRPEVIPDRSEQHSHPIE